MKLKISDKYNKIILIMAIALGAIVFCVFSTAFGFSLYYKDKILPNIYVADINVGGKTAKQAKDVLMEWQETWWKNQMQYRAVDEDGRQLINVDFFPVVVSEDSGESYDLVWFDWDDVIERAHEFKKDPLFVKTMINIISLVDNSHRFDAPVRIEEKQLIETLRLKLREYENPPVNASFEWKSYAGEPRIISEKAGNVFDYAKAVALTEKNLRSLIDIPVVMKREYKEAEIKAEDVVDVQKSINKIKEAFPITLYYDDPVIDFERTFKLTWLQAYRSLQPEILDKETFVLNFNYDYLDEFFQEIEERVNRDYQDAKFQIGENGRVELFQPSQKGYLLNREQTTFVVNQWIESGFNQSGLKNIQEPEQADSEEQKGKLYIIVDVIEPQVSTKEINDLGISEILGVGYSNFSGSPANRVHNISVGASKLNGLLVAPDEEFSLLGALKPFTVQAGFLPELVIKGDKITPEIGGGLCQIGTTTFRATMKSGLPVTQRRNHSLVVSYYNDPRNGSPGTDATIYDPAPDFRFKNDTGNYILITTAMNKSTGDLIFTFWGTNDGRTGDYTVPIVHNWIPAGEPQYVDSEDLEPGQEKCQGAHPGANTSFTYTITRPDGTLEEQVFSSHYRALPKICLVGIDPDAQSESDDGAPQENADSDVVDTPQSSEDTVSLPDPESSETIG